MRVQPTALLLSIPYSRDVVVLRWPEQRDEVERLQRAGVARLLLLEPDTTPPEFDNCLQDWVRLPASDADVRARLRSLERRASTHESRPDVSEFGELSHRGRSLFLSQLDQRVAELLVEQFGAVIPESELRNQVWPEGATQQALRVHVSRLRRRIAPLGLTIISIRCKGYVMREIARDSESGSSSQPAVR